MESLGAKLRAEKLYMERAIQQLYPLELSCDRQMPALQVGMNTEAAPFAACLCLQEITQEEDWTEQSEWTVLSTCI